MALSGMQVDVPARLKPALLQAAFAHNLACIAASQAQRQEKKNG